MTYLPAKKMMGAKRLLADSQLPLDVGTFERGLLMLGLMELTSYISTAGTGEIKQFIRLSDAGLRYGMNLGNHFHPFKTEPRYFIESFPHLYLEAALVIADDARQRFAKSEEKL